MENYEPNTDIETHETDTESDITGQQLEEEENDIDEVIFIDDDTDNQEKMFTVIHLYLNEFNNFIYILCFKNFGHLNF